MPGVEGCEMLITGDSALIEARALPGDNVV